MSDANNSDNAQSHANNSDTVAALPACFLDLTPFSGWALETWRERYEKRLASTMDEMQAFYDAMMPRLPQILEHCDSFALHDLPGDTRNLLLMVFALGEASFPVEAWRQPRVPDSGSADLELVREPRL
ncbi:hypothetical protein [Candidatus Poriferisocius sp.]|uniref:hypothetical protein n=1 Tax=Candidatus Poriferisocius sp. TaxID=3101276 RepID=UPI003B01B12E